MRDFKSVLEIVRIPGVFTAHADIVAGALVAGAGIKQLPDLFLLLIISSCFFFAGMALNDYFDREVDKKERPARPIPSGRISENEALFLGILLSTIGVIISIFVNYYSFTIALLLLSSILLYDGGMKKVRWAGPLNMGLCRYLNLLLGISILPIRLTLLMIPVLNCLYIFGITILSSSEVKGRNPISVMVCAICIVGVFLLYCSFGELDLIHENFGVYFCLFWMMLVLFFPLRLFKNNAPVDYQKSVKYLLLFLVALDGVIVIGTRSILSGLFVFPLILPGGYVAKRYYIT